MTITAERLRKLLSYDRETGEFIWLLPPWNHANLRGQTAGCNSTGYVLIRIDGRKHKAHRLAWLYEHGSFPSRGLDHRDGNPFNNAIANLREATQAQNGANAARWAGKSLPKGVRITPGANYQARISFEKQLITLGTFPTVDEAAAAYFDASQRLYGEFARAA